MDLDATLNLLASKPEISVDLAEIALQLARDEYPDLDVEAYLSQLTAMAHESQRYLAGGLEARLAGLCRYLFHDMGFRGNVQTYYDPRNSYLNEVIERRTGIPITWRPAIDRPGMRACCGASDGPTLSHQFGQPTRHSARADRPADAEQSEKCLLEC